MPLHFQTRGALLGAPLAPAPVKLTGAAGLWPVAFARKSSLLAIKKDF